MYNNPGGGTRRRARHTHIRTRHTATRGGDARAQLLTPIPHNANKTKKIDEGRKRAATLDTGTAHRAARQRAAQVRGT